MRQEQVIAAALSLVLVAVLTFAVIGRMSWLWFYGLAVISLGYLQWKKKRK